MDAEADAPGGTDLAGVSAYDIAIETDGRFAAWLRFGSGTVRVVDDGGDTPPGVFDARGDTTAPPALSVVLEQPELIHPGTRRTLFRDDFGAARVEASIGQTVYVDDAPQIELAFDLATGATVARIEGLLVAVGGEKGPDRPYAIEVDAITPLYCLYRSDDPQRADHWKPPAGEVDVCRTIEERADALPAVSGTPEPPWEPAPTEAIVCDSFG